MAEVINFSINSQKYGLVERSAGGSVVKALCEYANSGSGIYNTLGVGEKAGEVALKFSDVFILSSKEIEDLTFLTSGISSARKYLIITKLIGHTVKEFFDALSDMFTYGITANNSLNLMYSVVDLTKDVACFVLLFAVPLAAKFLLKKAISCLSFVKTAWDMKKDWNEFGVCSSLGLQACSSVEYKDKILLYSKEKKRHLMLCTVANVLDVALTAILFAGALLSSTFVAPVGVVWGVGLVSFGVSYLSDIYERSMTYKLKKPPENIA